MNPSASDALVLIVGQGYVGSTLARACLRAGYRVHGVDRDPLVRERMNERFTASGTYEVSADVVPFEIAIIAVDTPLTANGHPNLDALFSAVASLGTHLSPGGLIINESTVPPGTTDAIVDELSRKSGLPAAEFDVAFSPERIDPGNESWTMVNTPKLVAGSDERACTRAADFYRSLAIDVVEVASLRDAEFAKLAENAFRAVSIAFVNEMASVARRLGVDIRAALDAAATKPFGYLDFRPGIGVGGDCIPTDPHFLVHAAGAHAEDLPLVRQALSVNADMPHRVTERAIELLAGSGAERATVLLVGLAHKRNHPDLTNAPSLTLARLLIDRGIEVTAIDPHINPALVPPGVRLLQRYEPVDAELVITVTIHDELVEFIDGLSVQILDTRAELTHSGVARL